ncbi:MAG: hypothetical protein KGL35_06060 [Bradyrhizobium sp.]|nr:hypothetical protein [Bradyrhizobium sp.]
MQDWWGTVDHWLQESINQDALHSLGLDDIHRAVEAQEMQLWIVLAPTPKGAVVTQIANYPKARSLAVVLCGGFEMPSWIAGLVDVLKRYAKHHGCQTVACNGRKGWVRVLQGLGWREIAVTVALEV